jgi:hypothetical protein
MGLLLKKGLKIIPQDISSSLAATWRRASREHALNLIKEGNSGRLSRRVPGRKSKPCSSRPSPGGRIPETKEALETSPSTSPGNSQGNPECQKLPGCSQCQSPWKPLLQARLSHRPMGFGRKGGDRGYLPSFAVQRVLSAARLPENPKAEISLPSPFPLNPSRESRRGGKRCSGKSTTPSR